MFTTAKRAGWHVPEPRAKGVVGARGNSATPFQGVPPVRCSGFTLLECMVAGVLLAATALLCLQTIAATTAARRAEGRRQTAVLEASNLMERLATRPWAELTTEGAKDVTLGEEAKRTLPGAQLDVRVDDETSEPAAKRITVSITYDGPGGEPVRPARLVAWRYRAAEEPKP
jgi:type II secretory pathway pseudopilin PulG